MDIQLLLEWTIVRFLHRLNVDELVDSVLDGKKCFQLGAIISRNDLIRTLRGDVRIRFDSRLHLVLKLSQLRRKSGYSQEIVVAKGRASYFAMAHGLRNEEIREWRQDTHHEAEHVANDQ